MRLFTRVENPKILKILNTDWLIEDKVTPVTHLVNKRRRMKIAGVSMVSKNLLESGQFLVKFVVLAAFLQFIQYNSYIISIFVQITRKANHIRS